MNAVFDHFGKVSSRSDEWKDVVLTDEMKRMVMASCDVRGILESWGVHPVLSGREWRGYCPDHVLHDGHPQHAPKWSMNAENGDCVCFTSSKASNFVYIAKRLYNLPTIEKTIEALTGGNSLVLPLPNFVADEAAGRSRDEEDSRIAESRERGITMMKRLLERGQLSDGCVEYFARDGITRDTLEFLGVCSVESGSLDGRAMIPFLDKNHEICGYVAVNYRGVEWWVKHEYDRMRKIDPGVTEASIRKSYRKTLYCPGFKSRDHLYGQYEVLNGQTGLDDLVMVEGERDAMKLLQEGIDCVSIHGTSLKPEQKVSLKAMNPKRIYIGLDMDSAGCIAALKAYDTLFSEMESVLVVNFPDGKDPKKFNGEEIRRFLNHAKYHTYENCQERMEIAETRKV